MNRPPMPSVERTITVDKPVDVVWAYLSDFTNTEDWDPPTVSTVRTSGDGGVGTTYKNVSKMLGHESEVEYEVVRFEPNSVFELTGSATGLSLRDTITFEGDADTTTVTYRSEFSPHGAAKRRVAREVLAGDPLRDEPALPRADVLVGDEHERGAGGALDLLEHAHQGGLEAGDIDAFALLQQAVRGQPGHAGAAEEHPEAHLVPLRQRQLLPGGFLLRELPLANSLRQEPQAELNAEEQAAAAAVGAPARPTSTVSPWHSIQRRRRPEAGTSSRPRPPRATARRSTRAAPAGC